MKSRCGCMKERNAPMQSTSGFGRTRREHAARQGRSAPGSVPSDGYDAVSRSSIPEMRSPASDEARRGARVDASSRRAALRDPQTGLPRGIKRAAEAQSGIAMDDVRVRYNSSLPGTVRAKAATRGARIDVAPGQDNEVGHELWHVVQQKLRRVSANDSRNGHAVSHNSVLESEADAFRDDAMPPQDFGAISEGLRKVSAPAVAPMQLQDSEDEISEDEVDISEDDTGGSSSGSVESDDGRPKKKLKNDKGTGAKAPGRKTYTKATKPAKDVKRKPAKKYVSSSESEDSSSASDSEDDSGSSSGDDTSSTASSEDESSSSSVEQPKKKSKVLTKTGSTALKKKAEPKKTAPPKKKVAAKRKAEDSDDEGLSDVAEADWETGKIAYHGVQQQGKVSIAQGKHYAGPRPMTGKRADQVSRHVANLTLNRATKAQKDKGSKTKPVEVQMSSVGGRVLINANNRESTETIATGVGTGSLYDYVTSDDAQKPALDQDNMRPLRYRSKLQKVKSKTRPWQKKGAVGENATDVGKAEKIMESIQEKGIGRFDLDDEPGIKKQIADWKAGKGPKSYVVLHGKSNLKGEHAERVQSAFRDKWLKEFEDKNLSTPPTGPKTTCLGCTSYHAAHYPHILPTPDLSGAYFGAGSPATTKDEIEKANETVKNKPATGSIGQEGYIRNSDYPDSDSDDEGKPSYPRAMSFTLPQGAKNPDQWTWKTTPTETIKVKSSEMRYQVENRRRKSKGEKVLLPKPVNPSTPKAPPKKRKADSKKSDASTDTPKKKVVQKKKEKVKKL